MGAPSFPEIETSTMAIADYPDDPRFLDRDDGARLAYRHRTGSGPTFIFLPGYMSDMEGSKALAIDAWAEREGKAMLRLDYSGCGASDGRFEDGTLEIWRDDVLHLLNTVVAGPVVLIGSSMGGWLMLLVAKAISHRIAGLAGIAAAPDFTDWGFSDAEKATLLTEGRLYQRSDYYEEPSVTTLSFWRSGENNRVLDDRIALDCPVRLLQGQCDEVVPWKVALRLGEALTTADLRILLIKDGDHRLSRESDIALLLTVLAEIA